MTPLEAMRLTAEDPEAARASVDEILLRAIGARRPERDELLVILGALNAAAADVSRRLAAHDARLAVEAAEGRRVLSGLHCEPGPSARTLIPSHSGWKRAWAIIAERHGADVGGERWQYMGTFGDHHEFRHRARGRDVVLVSARDFDEARL